MTALLYCKQRGQALTCLDRNAPRKHGPQAFLRTVPQARNMTFEDRYARKQHLMRDQPRCGPVEQSARSVSPGPAQSIEPAVQSEAGERVRKLDEPAVLANLGSVIPPPLAVAVVLETAMEALNAYSGRSGPLIPVGCGPLIPAASGPPIPVGCGSSFRL
jgi:hypothetical protein